MSLKDYVLEEFKRAGFFDEDEDDPLLAKMSKAYMESILELIKVFEDQGHSGYSAGQTIRMFSRLANYKPLTALTGDDDEWRPTDSGIEQNTRYSSVFRDKEKGIAYDINAVHFKGEDGGYFKNADSRVEIEFPYVVPDKPEVVDLSANFEGENNDIQEEGRGS